MYVKRNSLALKDKDIILYVTLPLFEQWTLKLRNPSRIKWHFEIVKLTEERLDERENN